jgi:hypothetical protein
MILNIKRANRMLGIITFVFLILMVINQTAYATSMDDRLDVMTVPDYIYNCYDGNGFANQPGLRSTLATTLEAVQLLQQYDQSQWSSGTWQILNDIVDDYAGMQSGYRGGFVLGSNDAPDFKTTALVLETLRLLNRIDAIDIQMVERYLWSSFRGSLSLEHLLSDGLFEDKYWAIRAADSIDNIEILGLRQIDLENIISPDASLMEFPEIDEYIRWKSMILSNDSKYGGGFEAQSFADKTRIIEILDLIINDDSYNPTIMPTLFDVDRFVEEATADYNKSTGMIMTRSGNIDSKRTAQMYDVLDKIGELDELYDFDFGAYRAVEVSRKINALLDSWSSDDEVDSVATIHSLTVVRDGVDKAVNAKVVFYTPLFESTHGE